MGFDLAIYFAVTHLITGPAMEGDLKALGHKPFP